jgi:hypothetical protein
VKSASIVGVLHAIKTVAPAHRDVRSWWYAPPRRLRLAEQRPLGEDDGERPTEVVVEGPQLDGARLPVIAADLSRALGGAPAVARLHRGDDEDPALFRILSARDGGPPAREGHARLQWRTEGGPRRWRTVTSA